MADQQAPPEGAPEQADTPEGTGAQQDPWQERYEHLQPEYTRATQEAAQLRDQVAQYADPEYRAQLFREIAAEQGFEIQEAAEDDGQLYQEVDPRIRAELDELKQWRDSTTTEQQQAQHIEWLDSVCEQQFGSLGAQLSDQQEEWITNRAFSMPPKEMPDGSKVPDISGAYAEYQALIDAEKQTWAKSKRAPHVSSAGKEGTQVPNLDNRQERLDWMSEQLLANEQ